MDNAVSQSEELIALQSIYDEEDLIVENLNPPSGRFVASVQLPKKFSVTHEKFTDDGCQPSTFHIDYLPPIDLIFKLPDTYPSESCPAFLLCCPWLTAEQLSKLCRKLESIWNDASGEVILFSWINFLQEETLEYLGITDELRLINSSHKNTLQTSIYVHPIENTVHQSADLSDLSTGSQFRESKSFSEENVKLRTDGEIVYEIKDEAVYSQRKTISYVDPSEKICGNINTFPLNAEPSVAGGTLFVDCRALSLFVNANALVTQLKEYDRRKKQEVFQRMLLTCEICFAAKKGYEFISFYNCNHNYCKECLKSYLEIQIAEGNVHSLNCPETGCSSQADGTLVRRLVSDDLFRKYDSLLLSRTLESMSDIAYCPRQACQSPVLLDVDSKMGCCPRCSFPFCVFCRMAYHGVAPCALKLDEKRNICEKYMKSTGAEKTSMERRFGRRELQFLVDNFLSEDWVNSNSKQCPKCQAKIEKNDGCNKMTCFRCGMYFCWLCMTPLNSSNPYSHFSNPISRCYNQLFPEDFDFVMPGEFLEL